ncbi:MAG: hypothetical protein AMJ69_06755 [Gammaproteobacteria bacterium SG8_47]|nr:MAG: hypothetical protein AMJ69_06755 [Gammaproteobacteria bacterium SG8_47]
MSEERSPQRPRAVALRYDGDGAPRVTAKGQGHIAERIIALAQDNDVPLHEDVELVGLLSQIELGEEIPRALYVAVAHVLAFAYLLKNKVPRPEAKDDEA